MPTIKNCGGRAIGTALFACTLVLSGCKSSSTTEPNVSTAATVDAGSTSAAADAAGPVSPMIPLGKLPAQTALLHPSLEFLSEKRWKNAVMVTYETWAQEVHGYYERTLEKRGWKRVEPLNPDELTACGGDWGGYYHQGQKRMRFHICGPPSSSTNRASMPKLKMARTIRITTYGFHPRQLLGKTYKRSTGRGQTP